MKKIVFLLIMLLFVSVPAFSEQNDDELSFKDFCPYKEYANIDTSKKYFSYSKKYWSQRKSDFEAKKAECGKMQQAEQKNECYQKLKTEEEELTNKYVAARSTHSYSSNRYAVQNSNTLNKTYTQMNTYKPLNNYGSSSTYSLNPIRTQPSYSYTNNHFNTWKPTSGHYGYGKW